VTATRRAVAIALFANRSSTAATWRVLAAGADFGMICWRIVL
jgi:hypothetical protein